MKRRLIYCWILCASILLAGCAGEPKQFSMGTMRAEDLRRLLWPPSEDGAVPRYVFRGLLVGEENFVKAGQSPNIRFTDVVNFITGEEQSSFENPSFLFRPQFGVIDDAGGRILVTDMAWQGVFVFDTVGGEMEVWRRVDETLRFVTPAGIALGMDGEIYVADAELALVARISRQGRLLQVIGKGQLQRPTGLAFDRKNRRLYVADTRAHQIKVFDAGGAPVSEWGEHGGEGEDAAKRSGEDVANLTLNFPTHMTLKKDKLYVTDTMNARIHVLSAQTGRTLRVIGKRGMYVGNMSRPKGIAVDSEENIYVVEGYFDHLLIYNRDGQFLMSIGGTGNGPGKFSQPNGVWIDSRDRVFVADSDNARVQVFQFLGGGSENLEEN